MPISAASWIRWANTVETQQFLAWLNEQQQDRLRAAMYKACSSTSTQEDLLRAKTLEDIKQHIAELQKSSEQ
jgi:hypothetical protein